MKFKIGDKVTWLGKNGVIKRLYVKNHLNPDYNVWIITVNDLSVEHCSWEKDLTFTIPNCLFKVGDYAVSTLTDDKSSGVVSDTTWGSKEDACRGVAYWVIHINHVGLFDEKNLVKMTAPKFKVGDLAYSKSWKCSGEVVAVTYTTASNAVPFWHVQIKVKNASGDYNNNNNIFGAEKYFTSIAGRKFADFAGFEKELKYYNVLVSARELEIASISKEYFIVKTKLTEKEAEIADLKKQLDSLQTSPQWFPLSHVENLVNKLHESKKVNAALEKVIAAQQAMNKELSETIERQDKQETNLANVIADKNLVIAKLEYDMKWLKNKYDKLQYLINTQCVSVLLPEYI